MKIIHEYPDNICIYFYIHIYIKNIQWNCTSDAIQSFNVNNPNLNTVYKASVNYKCVLEAIQSHISHIQSYPHILEASMK